MLVRNCNCRSVNTVNQHADVTGVQPCTTPWKSPLDFCGFSSSSSPSECDSDRGKSPPSSSKNLHFLYKSRQSFPLAKHQTDYPVSILLVTENHVSMHILHNLLVVTCRTVCASQHFTRLEHPNILQQTNKHLVQNQPLVIPPPHTGPNSC